MNKASVLVLVAAVGLVGILGSGCAKKSASAGEAIQTSQSITTIQGKNDYLIGQARAFYNSKEYQDVIQTAQYVLNNVDKDSQAAKDLIVKAKTQLQEYAQKTAGDMSNKLLGK